MVDLAIQKKIAEKWESFSPRTQNVITVIAVLALAGAIAGAFYGLQRKYNFINLTNMGQIVGISIAIGVGGALFITGLALLIKRLREQKSDSPDEEEAHVQNAASYLGYTDPRFCAGVNVFRNFSESERALHENALMDEAKERFILYTLNDDDQESGLYVTYFIPGREGSEPTLRVEQLYLAVGTISVHVKAQLQRVMSQDRLDIDAYEQIVPR